MNKIYIILIACLIFIGGNSVVYPQDSLFGGFSNPPASTKARTWWHWVDGNITKEGITTDLEAMKRVGIQEAQIFNVSQSLPQGPAIYLSDHWLDLLQFAAQEADRLGMEIAFNNAAGWSNSGGPWVTPEYAMQTVVYSEVKLEGKKTFKGQLPLPPSRLDYYVDIAVLAFPSPEKDQRITDLALKSLSGETFPKHLQPDDQLIDKSAIIRKDQIVNLTSRLSADGQLEWEVPAGNWTILRVGHTPTGAENRPAVLGGKGLECDKMSRKAVDKFWNGGVQPILDRLGALVGKSVVNCLIDSYEVGCNNWTADFKEEFEKRQGYDCISFLPVLAGYYLESGEVSERFLWDFRKNVGDLIVDNYYGYFRKLCNSRGLKFSVEPYGGPYEDIHAGSTGDVVMSEFWLEGDLYLNTQRMVASAAHLNGSPIVGAEAFTSFGGWREHPATLKTRGDILWCEGINRFIFHTYTHQPWNISPGVTFGPYGLDFNRHNTWWEQGKAYMDYLGRSQFLLQHGRTVADVLVFTGESSPNDGIFRADIKALGHDYDQIGTNMLKELSVNDGLIHSPVGGIYKMLVLPDTDWMTPDLIDKIDQLVRAGAIVAGPKPLKSPSLKGYPDCDAKVVSMAERIWDESGKITKGKVITNLSVNEILNELKFAPDFSGRESGFDLSFIHRTSDEADIYFIANPRNISRLENCSFRIIGKYPQIWDPKTGEMREAPVWKEKPDGTTEVPVFLESDGSVFVVFSNNNCFTPKHIVQFEADLIREELRPLEGLKIIKAEYGQFLPKGLEDATQGVLNLLARGQFDIHSGTYLVDTEPAAGVVKELRIECVVGGERHRFHALEGQSVLIDIKSVDEIESLRAIYGKFLPNIDFLPPAPQVENVSEILNQMIDSHHLQIQVDDRLIGKNSSETTGLNELRLTYSFEGETCNIKIPEGGKLNLALYVPDAELQSEKGVTTWKTPYAGKLTYTTSTGKTKTKQVQSVPPTIELNESWEVCFPPNQGAPQKELFDTLSSWSVSPKEGIRHFSGTAVYKKNFSIPKNLMKSGYSLELDLGSVRVIAEVIVNGKNLGVIWKAPFTVNLDHAVHEGINELEVRITNLWPNRLIGDEGLPEDSELSGRSIKEWPEWLLNHTERPSKRTTFTTYRHWNKEDHLLPSGLLGPVIIRPFKCINLK